MIGSDEDDVDECLEECQQDSPIPQLCDYEIISKIGDAGQSQVWHAIHLGTRKEVAIKIPKFPGYSSQQLFKRFEREIGTISRIEHPNIVRIIDSDIHKGVYFYAMELIKGQHLDDYTITNKLGKKEILILFSRICSGIDFMHGKGVIHRDLKPSNILVSDDGVPHILDFGLAKFDFEDENALTLTAEISRAGTPAFMSPEQASGDSSKAGVGSDIFSLGIMLYYLITGEYPFDLSGSREEVMSRIAQARLKPLAINKLDSELIKIFQHIFQKEPGDRYKSVRELSCDIENYLAQKPLLAGSGSAYYKMCRYVKKNKNAFLAGALALAATLSYVGYLWHYNIHNLNESFDYPQGTVLAETGLWQQMFSTYPEPISSIVFNGQLKEKNPEQADFVIVSGYTLHAISKERYFQKEGESLVGSIEISYDGYWSESVGLAFGIQDKDNFYFAELATKTAENDVLSVKKYVKGEVIDIAFKNRLKLDTSQVYILKVRYDSNEKLISVELNNKSLNQPTAEIYQLRDESFNSGQVGIITMNAHHSFLDNLSVSKK